MDSSLLWEVFIHSSKETSKYDITSREGDTPLHPLAIGNINTGSSTSTSRLPYLFVLVALLPPFFSSLTLTELLIWRILSVAITAVPIYIFLIPFLAGLLGEMMEPERPSITALYFVPLSGGILYLTHFGFSLWNYYLEHTRLFIGLPLYLMYSLCLYFCKLSIANFSFANWPNLTA